MRAALADIGVEAVCVEDGRKALGEIDQHQPQAIILDLMMPGFDGFAVLDALHRLPKWCDIPVFIWTSMILTDEEYASLAGSARTVVSKGGGDLMAMLERLKRWKPGVRA
jgi:CheY-like chemotaxis protein